MLDVNLECMEVINDQHSLRLLLAEFSKQLKTRFFSVAIMHRPIHKSNVIKSINKINFKITLI